MRICFYGPPGCGKSTVSGIIFGLMKKESYNVEYVQEFIKKWAYMKRVPAGYEQLYIFAKQLHSEDIFLRHGVDHIITDSPILLNWGYCEVYNSEIKDEIKNVALKWEKKHPSIHIWLQKGEWKYNATGRYETEQESINRSNQLYNLISGVGINFHKMDSSNIESIKDLIMKEINIT